MEMKFNEEDKKKFIEFLNYIAKNATFNDMKTSDIIDYFKLLSYVQKNILAKIDANMFEIKRVVESQPEVKSE